MKLTNWFLNFDFGGRARRSHYWANLFCWWLIFGALIAVATLIGAIGSQSGSNAAGPTAAVGVVFLLIALAALLSVVDGMATIFRRAHDTGKSGWIWLMLLVPLVNFVALYWLLIEDSQQGPNKYGPPVKQFYEVGAPA